MDPYQYINSFIKFGKKGGYKPGLKRIEAILAAFNDPQDKLNIIHVAGSNGKGSTIAYLKSIYMEAGYKVGVYTSPHLINFNERIAVNGRDIKDEELEELVNLLQPVVEKITASELGEPSFFEIVTTLAFLYFYQQQVDILLLEVGLGGRLDATNLIKSPLLSVITSISLEHTSILGDTVQQIAREKAGIIKQGSPVVVGVKDSNALETIKKIARTRKSQIFNPFKYYHYNFKGSSLESQSFSLTYQEAYAQEDILKLFDSKFLLDLIMEEDFTISILGEHQIRNAVVAMSVATLLQKKFKLDIASLKKGLKKAFIPGRMEILQKNPLLIVDGAHNTDGVSVFTSYINDYIRKQNHDGEIYIILAVLGDKDLDSILKELSKISGMKLIISENKSERALVANIIKNKADQLPLESQIIRPLPVAVKTILNKRQDNDIVAVVGSLYNIAEVKQSFR